MSTQLNNPMTSQYPAVPNFDDQIVSRDQVQYDVFSYGSIFQHVEVIDPTQPININQASLQLIDGQWLLNKVPQTVNQLHDHGLIVTQHDQLNILTTTLPVNDCLIGDMSQAGIRYQTPATAYLVRRSDNDFDFYLTPKKASVYLNDHPLSAEKGRLRIHDRLIVDGLLVVVEKHQLKLVSFDHRDITLNAGVLREETFQPIYPVDFPKFHRSPRIILTPPTDKVSLNQPESVNEEGKNSLVRAILPPLTMVAASLAASVLSGGNPLMSVGMGGASLVTGGLTTSAYFTNKKESQQKSKQRTANYEAYLINQTAKLTKLAEQQRHAAQYHYPDTDSIAEMIATYNSRLYEKTTNNADFLNFSLGTGYVPASYKVDFSPNDSQQDELVQQAQHLVADYQTLDHMPITTTLNDTTLGVVGRPAITNEAIQTLYLQLAAFHSYRDVQFITLVPEKDYDDVWAKWRWLPHSQIQSLNVRGLVHDTQSKDMVLNSFYQLINKRKQALKEAGHEGIKFAPHYILTIVDEGWLNGHQLNEFLAEDMAPYGVSVIWVKEDEAMLPETVTSYAKYDNKDAAELVNENGHYVAKKFAPLRLPEKHHLSQTIRRLANLHHVEAEKNAIPESVSFLELYKVKAVADLDIESRWAKANTSKSLAVPLGLRGKDDIVYLNLHERAHGPHGLVAGTTGSGKSETIQSYMLSLAVNFAPEDVGFLPIDFKGGGMANLFKDLPHLLGSITNLDGAGSARALASIRAELQKRQRLFGQYGVNHINGYTKLYKQGKTITDPEEKKRFPEKPLPHLFLISDEFAELKANEPDFMAELVSTARIGRSLGVHLILATQKPSGVVDDQIWSNSRFKLALKVQDVADSNEILKTPDAASIVEPGRAYLQVGNNEIYELFQSAWSGATYGQHNDDANKVDERIWTINNLGQYELLTTDLSSNDEVKKQDKVEKQTELEAVVAYIAQTAKADHAVLPDKPWLPPLGTKIYSQDINFEQSWKQPYDAAVPVALLDVPAKQEQMTLKFDLENMSHTLIASSPGYGKTTMLQTIVLNMAKTNTPSQIEFNLLDFGTNGLLPLRDLPQVRDIVNLDQKEKLGKMLNLISDEMDRRKQLFQKSGVSNLEQYELQGEHLPVVLNILDSYDAVTESNFRDNIDTVLDAVLREGAALGLYMLITANRSNSLRMAMLSNIETKFVLFMVDEGDLSALIGRGRIIQQEIIGRGQVKTDIGINAFQAFLPVVGEDAMDQLTNLRATVQKMNKMWKGTRPDPIPMVPEEFEEGTFDEHVAAAKVDATNLPLALALVNAKPIFFNPQKEGHLLLSFTLEQQALIQRTTVFEAIRKQQPERFILVDFNSEIAATEKFTEVITEAEAFKTLTANMVEYVKAAQEGRILPETYIFIADIESFINETHFSADNLKLVLSKAHRAGMHLVLQSPDNFIGKSFDMTAKTIRETITAGLVSARVTDTNLINDLGTSREAQLAMNETYFFTAHGRVYQKARMFGKIH